MNDDSPRFDSLPLSEAMQQALEAMGFETMTPVQAEAIPHGLEGRDVLAMAQTGTGKTAAFGIPILQREGRALVLTPTRELAKQVQRELQALGKGSPRDVICLIGGASFRDQLRAMERHPQAMLVATPGRVCDHLSQGTVDLSDFTGLVLDEADEMMSMGFQDELETIVAALPKERQTLLFSATMPKGVERLANKAMKDPVTVRIGGDRKAASTVEQLMLVAPQRDRAAAVRRILMSLDPEGVIVFCKTRLRVEELQQELEADGAEALHGGMQQRQRDVTMTRFRDGKSRILVATDVAARGLDVDHVDLVIHDDFPTDAETYVHRTGRTGRAGRSGKSILMIAPQGMKRLGMLRQVAGHLERYNLPTDEQIREIQAARVVESLQAVDASEDAKFVLDQALAAGLTPEQVALAALDQLIGSIEEEQAASTPGDKIPLALKVGKIDNVKPGEIVGCLCNEGGLNGDQIGRIDMLDRMSVVEIQTGDIEDLIQRLDGVSIRRQFLRPRVAEDWRFKSAPRS